MVSNIGFGVGAAAGLVGIILLATSGGSERTGQREGVSPYVGIGNAGVTGRF
jgi:hypothetical protein